MEYAVQLMHICMYALDVSGFLFNLKTHRPISLMSLPVIKRGCVNHGHEIFPVTSRGKHEQQAGPALSTQPPSWFSCMVHCSYTGSEQLEGHS